MAHPIPFYIVCFNRVAGLQYALDFVNSSTLLLEPVILDMGSTWQPFLDYRDSLSVRVVKFPFGVGPRDLWVDGEINKLGEGGFFLSDGDIDYSDIPRETAAKLKLISEKYPWFPKVGLALRITDLPNDVEGERVLKWEADNWKVKFSDDVYLNGVDTTIAYYPRRESTFYYRPSLRLAGAFQAKHYPWYERKGSLNEEGEFYTAIAKSSISSTQAKQVPQYSYRVKHATLVLLYRLFKIPLKLSFCGKFFVEMLAIRGKINPRLK